MKEHVEQADLQTELRTSLARGVTEDLGSYRRQEADLMSKIDALMKRTESLPAVIRSTQVRLTRSTAEVKRLQGLIELDDTDLYNATMNEKFLSAQANRDPNAERFKSKRSYSGGCLLLRQTVRSVREKRTELIATLQQLEQSCGEIENQMTVLETEREGLPIRIEAAASQLRDVRNAKDRLYQIFKGSSLQSITPPSTRSPQPRAQGASTRSSTATAEDLRHTSFETFELPTELGRFLGRLDRNKLAFALTGDSGAGKSHFAFEMTRLFSDQGFRTKYYCLEEGFGHLTQEKIYKFNIADDVVFAEQTTIADVRRDADKYEVIVVDSFAKLDVGAEEFERLRSDFPRTIFIIIFQKTNSGSMRGGSSIIFNSAAAIDVVRDGNDRIAHMVKGRYGTQGWRYDIKAKQVHSA